MRRQPHVDANVHVSLSVYEMTQRKKKVFLITGVIVLCLIVLREIGIVDVNLYKSAIRSNYTASKSQHNLGSEKRFSYVVKIKYEQETISSFTHNHDNLPQIEIEVILEKPIYSGNFAMPLIKNFRMTYRCAFSTTESPSGLMVNGSINGDITAKIQGICSRSKAKALAFEDAKKQIQSYLQKQLVQ